MTITIYECCKKLGCEPKPIAELERTGEEGIYFLDETRTAFVVFHKQGIEFAINRKNTIGELHAFKDRVPATQNPMNRNFPLRRKQCTFQPADIAGYRFAGQKSTPFALEDAPEVVGHVLGETRRIGSAMGFDTSGYNAVHANWYPDGAAGVAPHADDERDLDTTVPIFSYTFLPGHNEARHFDIYTKPTGRKFDPKHDKPIASIRLPSESYLIMAGDMQQRFLHGIKPLTRKADLAKFANAPRINLTVRALKPAAAPAAAPAAPAAPAVTGQKRDRE